MVSVDVVDFLPSNVKCIKIRLCPILAHSYEPLFIERTWHYQSQSEAFLGLFILAMMFER